MLQLLQTKQNPRNDDTHWATSQSDWLQFLLIFRPIRPVLGAESRHCRIEQGDGSTNGSVDLGGCRNDGFFDDAHWAVYGRRGRRTKPRFANPLASETLGFICIAVLRRTLLVSYHSFVKKRVSISVPVRHSRATTRCLQWLNAQWPPIRGIHPTLPTPDQRMPCFPRTTWVTWPADGLRTDACL